MVIVEPTAERVRELLLSGVGPHEMTALPLRLVWLMCNPASDGRNLVEFAAENGRMDALMRLGGLSVEMLDARNPTDGLTPRELARRGGHLEEFGRVAGVLDRLGFSWSDAEYPDGVVDFHARTGELLDRSPLADGAAVLADGPYTYNALCEETPGVEADDESLVARAIADGPATRVDGECGYAIYWPSFDHAVELINGRDSRAAVTRHA